MEIERRTLAWEAESPEALGGRAGRQRAALRGGARDAPARRYEELIRDTVELVGGAPPAATAACAVEAEYLLIVARKRGRSP